MERLQEQVRILQSGQQRQQRMTRGCGMMSAGCLLLFAGVFMVIVILVVLVLAGALH